MAERSPKYKVLREKMDEKGVTVTAIAELLGLRVATVSDKFNGTPRFYIDEAIRIQRRFFREYSLEYLFGDELGGEELEVGEEPEPCPQLTS